MGNCSAKATEKYELAREKVAAFINAEESREIVFTRNATEAINLVAYSWGFTNLKSGDEVGASSSSFLLFNFFGSILLYSILKRRPIRHLHGIVCVCS